MGDNFLGLVVGPVLSPLLETNNVMRKSYSYHSSRPRDSDDYHYRSRHTPYPPSDRGRDRDRGRHHYPRSRGSSYHHHESRSRDHEHPRRYHDLRASDPYRPSHNSYRRDHDSEYAHLRRTGPPDYAREDTRAPYPRLPPNPNPRYPAPPLPPSQYHSHQREPMHYPPPNGCPMPPQQTVRVIEHGRDPKFLHHQVPPAHHPNSYAAPIHPPVFPQQLRDEEDPPHIKTFKDCINQKLQVRIKYLEATLQYTQLLNEYEKSLEGSRALEKKKALVVSQRNIIQEQLTKLEGE